MESVGTVSNTDSHCKPDLDRAQALALKPQLLFRLYQISQVGGREETSKVGKGSESLQ